MRRFPDYDIIMMALPRWDGPYSSTAYSLSKELSRHTRVFYIDNPVTVKEYLQKSHLPEYRRRRAALLSGKDFYTNPEAGYPDLYAITPRLTVPINWLPAGLVYDSFAALNDAIISETLNQLIATFSIKKYVLVNSFNPIYGRFLSVSLDPALRVYQSVDDITQAPYIRKHGGRLENEMVRKADFTIVTSSELKRIKSQYSRHVFLLPNAANVQMFRKASTEDLPVPPEIRKLPAGKKIICYTGNICQRLDYALLKKLALVHHDKIVLMIGPQTRKDYITSGLSALPNVVFTGKKKIEELPAYLRYSDCCIIPFLCNQLTKSIYPLKINEYLSAGKPVVTTNFSDDIASFGEVAYVAGNGHEFARLVDRAIREDNDARKTGRMVFSSHNSWEARAHRFIDLTVEFLKCADGGIREPARRAGAQAVYG